MYEVRFQELRVSLSVHSIKSVLSVQMLVFPAFMLNYLPQKKVCLVAKSNNLKLSSIHIIIISLDFSKASLSQDILLFCVFHSTIQAVAFLELLLVQHMKQKAIVLMAVFKQYDLGMIEFSSRSQKELMLLLFLYTFQNFNKFYHHILALHQYDIFLLSHIIR